jgi:hypothetical protein
MIGTRTKAKHDRHQPGKSDLAAMYFTQTDWIETRCEINENKKCSSAPKRWGHCFTSIKNRVFMVGGNSGSAARAPLALYEVSLESGKGGDVLTWKKYVLQSGETISNIHSHSCEAVGDDLYVICGCVDNKTSHRIFKIDVERLTLAELKLPEPLKKRESHVSFPLLDRYVALYGGCEGTDQDSRTKKLGDGHVLAVVDILGQRKIAPSEVEQRGKAPTERESHSKVVNKTGVFIFGGMSITNDGSEESSRDERGESGTKESLNDRKNRVMNRRKIFESGEDGQNQADGAEPGLKSGEKDGGLETNLSPIDFFQREKMKGPLELGMVQTHAKEAEDQKKDEESSESSEEGSDFLNELFLLQHSFSEGRFVFTWTQVDYSGKLPRCSSLVAMAAGNDFLVFFGGEGYYPHKNYGENDKSDFLNSVYAVHLDSKAAFPLVLGGTAVEPLQSAATFRANGRLFVHGGENKQRGVNARAFELRLEQRVKKDLFGEFAGGLKNLCFQCKLDYDQAIINMEGHLRGQRKHKSKRVEEDKKEAIVVSEAPRFTIPQIVLEDIADILAMEHTQARFRPSGSKTYLLDKIALMIHTLRQPLFLSSMNFEVISQHELGIEFEGSFNIYEQMDKLEYSIMNSLFYYLVALAADSCLEVSYYTKLKSKILCFHVSGTDGNSLDRLTCRELLQNQDLPPGLRQHKFTKKNLIILSSTKVIFEKTEVLGTRDISLFTEEPNRRRIQHSIRSYFTLFFKDEKDKLTISLCGQVLELIFLNDILKRADEGLSLKVLDPNPGWKGITFTLKLDPNHPNPVWREFLANRTVIHYGPDYLIQKYPVAGASVEADNPNSGTVIIIIEKNFRPGI